MGKVLEIEIQDEQDKVVQFKANNDYPLLSREFFDRHGLHLIGTATTRFLLDIAFYSQNLAQKDIFPTLGLTSKATNVSAVREVFQTSKAMFIVALFGTFPGYWFTVFFIERIGRFYIQLIGFFMITTFVLPAELFPTRLRSTCHAISAASGKAGAMIGAFGVQSYTLNGERSKIKAAMIFFAFTNMLGFCCTFLVPETKGRSLEEISGEDGGQGGNGTQMTGRSSTTAQQEDMWEGYN
ncbi:hypothetical protein ACSBR2_008459 [Camellia fascicularis]